MWSLGATIFHAVEGHSPYETVDGNVIGTLYRIVNEPVPRPEHAGWLTPLIGQLMRHDPSSRWDSTRAAAYLAGGPDGGLATQTMAPAALPPGPLPVPAAPAAEPTSVIRAEPQVAPAPPPRRRRRVPLEALIAIALVAGIAVLFVAFLVRGMSSGGGPEADPGTGTSAGTSTGGSTGSSTGGSPGDGGSASTTPASSEATDEGITSFIESYLATAPKDPQAAFAQLTPEFQDQSGGLDGYSGFWDTIATATPSNIQPDANSLTVSYDVAYVRDDGGRSNDSVSLDLDFQDGKYLIAGES
jgi:hypothetical protein